MDPGFVVANTEQCQQWARSSTEPTMQIVAASGGGAADSDGTAAADAAAGSAADVVADFVAGFVAVAAAVGFAAAAVAAAGSADGSAAGFAAGFAAESDGFAAESAGAASATEPAPMPCNLTHALHVHAPPSTSFPTWTPLRSWWIERERQLHPLATRSQIPSSS